MPTDSNESLIAEKLDQAVLLLDELGIDAWLTFVRETTESGDPVLPIILGQPLTWQSALIVTRTGERTAIVGSHETEAVESSGVWPNVHGYVQGIRAPLLENLDRIGPEQLAVNFSTDDVKADGLTHGMYLLLTEYLRDTPHLNRLTSAAGIIGGLRGRKTTGEVKRIRAAIATTDEIFRAVAGFAEAGVSERAISRFMHDEIATRGLTAAWEADMCPIVNTGPDSMAGHALPSEALHIEPGRIFHLDFGVQQDSFCSDLQRVWYVPEPGETEPAAAVQRAFNAVKASIDAAAAVLKPGVECWRVDEAARATLTRAGYPEYDHATGHHVGRAAHDGGGVLGPRWERYGRTPHYLVEPGNVFTLELGVINVDGRGYLGLEEIVLVTKAGCEFLSTRQTNLWMLA